MDLLATSLENCVMTIMAIEAKLRVFQLGKTQIDVYKMNDNTGNQKIKILVLEIYLPSEIDYQKYKLFHRTAEDCPIKLNLEISLDIKLNWHQTKI